MSSTYTNLVVHVVFSTKHRAPLITQSIEDDLYRYLGGILRGESAILIEIGGMPDHVHLLLRANPTTALADLMRRLKANSSKWLNASKSPQRRFAWQDGYAAFSVSESQVDRVRAYIRNQREHHRSVVFWDELVAMLCRHNVEYDEQFIDG